MLLNKPSRWRADTATIRLTGAGKTKWGITEKTLNNAYLAGIVSTWDISELNREEARLIYKAFYWNPLKLDAVLAPSIAAEIFDTAVNMGKTAAVKIVQEALNYLGENLSVDGIMGMKTLGALNKWCTRDVSAPYSSA
jgi:lysozyme family protein